MPGDKQSDNMEPDGVIPTDEQAAEELSQNESDQVSDSDLQPPDTAGHPYGDGNHNETGSKTLDRLKNSSYGSK